MLADYNITGVTNDEGSYTSASYNSVAEVSVQSNKLFSSVRGERKETSAVTVSAEEIYKMPGRSADGIVATVGGITTVSERTKQIGREAIEALKS